MSDLSDKKENSGSGKAKTSLAKSKAQSTDRPLFVVAIGASAGGLEPIEQFFQTMPIDSGVAFVIVQHLSPDFKSRMDQLVARYTSMKIVQAEDGQSLEANTIYLNRPRTILTIDQGKLVTKEYDEKQLHALPINSFFTSLAAQAGDKAIGVILSGTGSDGTLGSLSIQEAGGIVICQDMDSSKFNSMPKSAMEKGKATIFANPKEMPALIEKIISGETISSDEALMNGPENPELKIFSLLQQKFGADFGHYKRSTVGRRIHRRATLNHFDDLQTYADSLQADPTELEALYSDLLIGVTSFMRDKEAFTEVELKVLPDLVFNMSEHNQIRIWTPGCATGQEAYTLAILISEIAQIRQAPVNLKIFATDLHFNSLKVAGAGIYNAENMASMPKPLIEKYFDEYSGNYQVKKSLRRHVVFSRQNLLNDPPFTNIDLITCRNLLIYFDDKAHKKVLASFHFSLKKDGFLFLGPSESVSVFEREFQTISEKWRIYQKLRDVRLPETSEFLPVSYNNTTLFDETRKLQDKRNSLTSSSIGSFNRRLLDEAYDTILRKHAPPSLLVDNQGELLHIFGSAEKYLKVSTGPFSRKLSEMIMPELSAAINAGIEFANKHPTTEFMRQIRIAPTEGDAKIVKILMEQLKLRGKTFIFITIEEREAITASPGASAKKGTDSLLQIQELEHDLRATELSLQSSVEQLETSNEELQSTNEELQSTNEELMSSNEELQSTNEELHSVNEELYTVSAEHQRKIEELTELTDDMDNLLKATDIGTIFLDGDLRLRRYTPAAARTFNLVHHDLHRPIDHITYNFELPSLLDDLRRVQSEQITINHEVDVNKRRFQLRAMPYKGETDSSSGLVLTMIDISDLKHAEQVMVEQRRLYANVVDVQREFICRMELDGTISFANQAFCEFYEASPKDLLGSNYYDLIAENTRDEERATIEAVTSDQSHEFLKESKSKSGTKLWTLWNCYAICMNGNDISEYQVVGRDHTEITRTIAKLTLRNQELDYASKSSTQFTQLASNDLSVPLRAAKLTAEWIEEDIPDEAKKDVAKHLNRLNAKLSELDGMVSELANYSNNANSNLEDESFSLVSELQNQWDAIEKPTDIKLQLQALPDSLTTKKQLLLSVMKKILENAVNNHDSAPGKVTIKGKELEDHWSFTIIDDGPSISTADQKKVLGSLQGLKRAENGTTNNISLAQACQVLALLGGKLDLKSDSKKKRGSTVELSWPK